MNQANFPARWNEELLAECQRIAHIGGWICDLTGRITWADETYRVFAVDPATFTPNLASFLQLVHPGDRSAVQAWTAACLAGEKPGELTFRMILPDGSIRLISGRGELKYDAENRPSHMTGALQDITEQERAEQRLRDSEMRARLLVESAPEAIFVQTGGCFAYLNAVAVRLFGADTADDLLGTPVRDRFHPDCREVVRGRIRLLNEEKSAVPQIEEVSLRLDGSPVPVEVSAVPIRYDGSDGALVFVRDITERKRVEARLAEQLDELRRWHKLTMGREGRVLELKQEVNELLARAGQPPRYRSVVEEPAGSEP